MTVSELLDRLRLSMPEWYAPQERVSAALTVACDLFHLDRNTCLLWPDSEAPIERERLDDACSRLSAGCPVEYVTGVAWFCGLRLEVGPGVLIPRPETEELAVWAAETLRGQGLLSASVLDVGTGSGAIALALADMLPGASVTGMDVSEDALRTARSNAASLSSRTEFVRCDLLRDPLPPGEYDLVISNPPYVPLAQRAEMRPNVREWEPETALFVPDDDPLLFYRALARKASSALRPGGWLMMEVSEDYAGETAFLMDVHGYRDVEVRRDMLSRPRMIRCRYGSR